MKYIRTKDGRIIELNNDLLYKIKNNTLYGQAIVGTYKIGEILKQADTIEELLDEFVILPLDQNKRPFYHYLRTPRIDDISHFINDNHIIYGAVWTDTELIYVAKMNEEGELELL